MARCEIPKPLEALLEDSDLQAALRCRCRRHRRYVAADSPLIEIWRVDALPVGTTVGVPLSPKAVELLALDPETRADSKVGRNTDWFCWDWPRVSRHVVKGANARRSRSVTPRRFDESSRRALIERGRQHPDLRRHIQAWESSKRRSSEE